MKPSTRVGADPKYCRACGDRYWSWSHHLARCARAVSEDTPCECRPGWQHKPDCAIVTGQLTPEEP